MDIVSFYDISFLYFRYGYAGSTDLMPNYDPFVEDLNRKIDDLTEELLSIRQLLKRLNLSPHSKIIRKIDLKIKRLLLNFDVKEEAISSDKNNVIDLGKKHASKKYDYLTLSLNK